MSRKFQSGDHVRRRSEYDRTRPSAVSNGAIGTVIEVENVPVLGTHYRMRVVYPADPFPAFDFATSFELVELRPLALPLTFALT